MAVAKLENEAHENIEHLTARLVIFKSGYLAGAIVKNIRVNVTCKNAASNKAALNLRRKTSFMMTTMGRKKTRRITKASLTTSIKCGDSGAEATRCKRFAQTCRNSSHN
jgi:hypothetical protein